MEQYQRNLSYVPICDNFLQNLLLFVIFLGEGQVRWKIEHTFHFQREKSRKAPHTPHVEKGKVYCLVWSHGGHFRVQSLDVHPSVSLAGSAHAHWVFWDLTFAVGLVAGTRWGLIDQSMVIYFYNPIKLQRWNAYLTAVNGNFNLTIRKCS